MSKVITLDNLKRFFSNINELMKTKSDISHKHKATDITTDELHQFVTSEEKEKINNNNINKIQIKNKYFLISGEETNNIEIPLEYRNFIFEEVYVDGIKYIRNLHYTINDDNSIVTFKKSYTFVEIELIVFL